VIRRRVQIIFAVALSPGIAAFVACSLDFNRYDPVGAGADVSTADTSTADASSDVGSTPEPSPEAARADAGPAVDAAADRDSGPCTPPAGCFQQATSCGGVCGQDYQKCTRPCEAGPSCTPACRSTEQSCLGVCATSCIACTQDAGCTASSGCLNATHP
jgi:hypothetical protein